MTREALNCLPAELRPVKWTHRQDLYLEHQVRRGEELVATGLKPDAAEAVAEKHNAEVGRLVEFIGVLKGERDAFEREAEIARKLAVKRLEGAI